MKLLMSLGNDPNAQALTGRTALHGAGHKGATRVIQVLVDAGARVDQRDLRKLMTERGMPIPPPNRTIESVLSGWGAL